MSKDGIQAFADEVTLIRQELDKLQRTSLNKREAEALHAIVAKAVKDMRQATADAPEALHRTLKADRDEMTTRATQAATVAAERVMGNIRQQLDQERMKLAQSAGEARRAAWRSFGGFWAWAASLLVTGAFLGLLTAYVTETAETLFSVEQMAPYSCGQPWFGGQEGTNDGGQTGCVFWYE